MKCCAKTLRELLADGPLTGAQIAEFFPDLSPRRVSRTVSDLRRRKDRQVYIKAWTLDDGEGGKRYPRAIYALGDKADARKPRPLTGAQLTERYRQKMRLPRVANSVFSLAGFV